MSLTDLLAPNLSQAMPAVAHALMWLLVADALMIASVLIAAISLVYFRIRLASDDPRLFTGDGRLGHFRQAERALRHLRRVVVVLALLIGVIWVVLAATGRSRADLVELLFSVIGGALLLPIYFVITILHNALARVAERLEELSRSEP